MKKTFFVTSAFTFIHIKINTNQAIDKIARDSEMGREGTNFSYYVIVNTAVESEVCFGPNRAKFEPIQYSTYKKEEV